MNLRPNLFPSAWLDCPIRCSCWVLHRPYDYGRPTKKQEESRRGKESGDLKNAHGGDYS